MRAPLLILIAALTCAMTVKLIWDYPQMNSNIVFNVRASTSWMETNVSPVFVQESMLLDDTNDWVFLYWMTNVYETWSMDWRTWPVVAITTNLECQLQVTQSAQFYYIGASNILTGQQSK